MFKVGYDIPITHHDGHHIETRCVRQVGVCGKEGLGSRHQLVLLRGCHSIFRITETKTLTRLNLHKNQFAVIKHDQVKLAVPPGAPILGHNLAPRLFKIGSRGCLARAARVLASMRHKPS